MFCSIDLMGTIARILMQDLFGYVFYGPPVDERPMLSYCLLPHVACLFRYRNHTLKYGAWGSGMEPVRSMGGPASKMKKPSHACNETVQKLGRCFITIDGEGGRREDIGPDVYLEVWPNGGGASGMEIMVYKERKVKDLGPIGYNGRDGLYSVGTQDPKYFLKGLEFWKSYLNPANVDILANMSVTNASLNRALNLAGNTDVCGPPKNTKFDCPGGRYTPPQCINNPNCRDILMRKPVWTVGWGQQLVRNLNLNFTIVWLGDALKPELLQFLKNQGASTMTLTLPTTSTSTSTSRPRFLTFTSPQSLVSSTALSRRWRRRS